MKLSQQIRQWLKSGTYAEGLAIYNKVKINRDYDKFLTGNFPLASPQGTILKTQLSTAISKLLNNPKLDIDISSTISGSSDQQADATARVTRVVPVGQPSISAKPNPLLSQTPKNKQRHCEQSEATSNNKQQTTNNSTNLKHQTTNNEHSLNPIFRIVDNPYVELSKLPHEYAAKYESIKVLYAQFRLAHENMKAASDDASRKLYLNDAIKHESKIKDLWFEIDTFAKQNPEILKQQQTTDAHARRSLSEVEGRVVSPEASTDFKKLTNLTRNILRHKKDLREKQLTARKRAEKTAIVNKLEIELNTLKKKLGVDGK